jgi:hypothetical protein
MAVTDVTIDNVVRRALAMKGVSLHYYVPMLIIAKRGLEDMQFDTLQKFTYVKLNLPTTGDKIVSLPSDYVDYVKVAIETGDKLRPLGLNTNINRRDNSGAAFEVKPLQWSPDDSYVVPSLWYNNFYDPYGANKGRRFGASQVWENSFTVNREAGFLRVDNNFAEAEAIHLIYLTLPKKVTNQSILHPFAQNALIDYMLWKWAAYTGDRQASELRHEYFESYRKLRARMNKGGITDVIRSLRRNNNMAIKS